MKYEKKKKEASNCKTRRAYTKGTHTHIYRVRTKRIPRAIVCSLSSSSLPFSLRFSLRTATHIWEILREAHIIYNTTISTRPVNYCPWRSLFLFSFSPHILCIYTYSHMREGQKNNQKVSTARIVHIRFCIILAAHLLTRRV